MESAVNERGPDMTLFILDAFQKAFGGTPDEKTVTAFAGAMDSGMRESTIANIYNQYYSNKAAESQRKPTEKGLIKCRE